jgi:preprotein translocase subunit SecA
MVAHLREMTTAQLMRVELQQGTPADMDLPDEDELPPMEIQHFDTDEDDAAAGNVLLAARPTVRSGDVPKVGRNDPCPCGSGKKYKHCHGAYA